MKTVSMVDITIVFIYLIAMLLIGFLVRKKAGSSTDSYLLADRGLGFFMIFACIAALSLGGGSTLGAAKLGFEHGFGGSWYLIWAGLGITCLGLVFSRRIVRTKITTVSELFSLRYGKLSRVYSAIIMTAYQTVLCVAQVIAAGTVLSGLTGMDPKLAMIIGGGIGLLYSYLGGMVAITMTDLAQWVVMTLGVFVVLLPFSIIKAGGISNIIDAVPADYWNFGSIGLMDEIIPKFLLFFFGLMVGQETWQRMLTAKNETISYRGTTLGGVYAVFYGLTCVFIGICAYAVFPNLADPQSAFITMVREAVPIGLSGLIYAGILSAIMSTMSGPLLASATLITNDVVMVYSKKTHTDKEKMRIIRFIMGSLSIFILVAALFIQDLIVAVDLAFAILVGGLFVPIMAALYWDRANAKAANVAMLVSSVVILIALFKFGFDSFIPILIGFVVSLILFVTIAFLTKPNERNLVKERLAEHKDTKADDAKQEKQA